MGSKISRALLNRGFFPAELPPIFSSRLFGASIAKLRRKGFGASAGWTSCDHYNMPHAKSGRRVAAIVNPAPFFGLSEEISKNWSAIRKLYDRSRLSFSRPVFNGSVRSIGSSDFEGYRESLLTRSSGYSFVLHADFARFFPTIYTHAIEWAVHGKAACKANLKLPKRRRITHWGQALDVYVRNMQDGQTQGLPIGPDTSYIVSEIVSTAIDKRLGEILKEDVVGSRLIDDYALFFETRSQAEKAHSALAIAASEFQIALNDEKTYIEEIGGVSRESWIYQLQNYDSPKDVEAQKRGLIRFTDLAMSLIERFSNPSIARYAIRVISGHIVHQRNIDLAIACVLRLSQIGPNSIPLVASFVIGYSGVGYKFKKAPVATYLTSVLSRSLDLGYDKEASWCLWLALNLKIKIADEITSKVATSNSSVVILLARVLEANRLCSKIRQGVLGKKLVGEDFQSPNWLLAYEGAMRGWFGWSKPDISGSVLAALADADVFFMDIISPAKGAIRAKAPKAGGAGAGQAFSFDEIEMDELDEYLEIDVPDDVYGNVDGDLGEDEEDEGEGEDEEDEDEAYGEY